MNISKSRIFFKNPTLSLFYLYSPLTSYKKSEKSLEPLLRKLRYQSTNYYQKHRSYRTWVTPVQQKFRLSNLMIFYTPQIYLLLKVQNYEKKLKMRESNVSYSKLHPMTSSSFLDMILLQIYFSSSCFY